MAPWNTDVGVRVAWQNELDQLAQQRAKLQGRTLRFKKVVALVPVSEELAEDAGALDAYLRLMVPGRIDYAISAAILSGDGLSRPLGLVNSPAAIAVAKEGAQGTGSFNVTNAQKMLARLYAPARANAVWIMSPDVEQQAQGFTFPAYAPAGVWAAMFELMLDVPGAGIEPATRGFSVQPGR